MDVKDKKKYLGQNSLALIQAPLLSFQDLLQVWQPSLPHEAV